MVPRSIPWRVLVPVLTLVSLLTEIRVKPELTRALAQQGLLTVEDIYGYEGSRRFSGSLASDMTWTPMTGPWLSDTHYLWPGADGVLWMQVDAVSGSARPLVTSRQLESALVRAGAPSNDASRAAMSRPSNFNAQRDALLVTVDDDLYLYDIGAEGARRLTSSPDEKIEATFSPDGRAVAFIKKNNVHVTAASTERALTTDGSAEVLNGLLDWVYSEELYGRGTHRAFWWSPDSRYIAFLQLDERPVPEYTLVDDIPYHPEFQRWDYPKAGDPNPIARLGIVSSAGGAIRWVDTSKYSDFLIVNVGWTPDSGAVVYQIQDRQQRWLELNRAEIQSGRTSTLLRETSETWVERWQDSSADPVWLSDGSFLWLSERTGWRHVYHYSSGGALIRQVTNGDWEVRRVYGLDRSQEVVFIDATAHSAIGLDLYRVGIDGGNLERITVQEGRHRAFLNPSRDLYLDSWSDVSTPPQVRLHRTATNAALRVVDANPVPALKEYTLSKPDLLQVKARDGFVMEAMMIKPPDFDPSRRYPVYQFTYAGPHSQQVVNGWGGSTFMYHQLLAQRGIVVWVMDNRTASGKGMRSAWPLYRNLGALELRDIEDGIAWLRQQPYVDGNRIGISGISYGAFMTLYALTHSTSFTMGIAEGAVTDWRNYDTIYTERYMGLPKENVEGYRRSSPRFSARNLNGQLLLIHGTLDDNVHPQNAMQLAHELQQAGKQFQMMMYPKSAHGVSGAALQTHVRNMMLDFTMRNLLR
jgi:dipeptidyl-peptidase-4